MARTDFIPESIDSIFTDADEIHQPKEIMKKIKQSNKMIQQNKDVDVDKVYGELASLISIGNDILKSAKYAVEVDPTAEGILAGTASMLNAIKDTVKEFSKIHMQNLRFNQQIELEKIKQRGKEKLLKMRGTDEAETDTMELVPFNQEDVIANLISEQKKNRR